VRGHNNQHDHQDAGHSVRQHLRRFSNARQLRVVRPRVSGWNELCFRP
jgi:hypothetical protein